MFAPGELKFGSGEAMLRAIDLIGEREGLGNILAEGSRRAAHAIGQGAVIWVFISEIFPNRHRAERFHK